MGIPIDLYATKQNIKHIMNRLRKLLTATVMGTTMFAMTGFLNIASAAVSDGALIKSSGNAAVYLVKGGKKYVFPNEKVYFTWYSDWNNIQVVSTSELSGIPYGGNVNVRPGTKLLNFTGETMVYAVEPGGSLRSIVSEANAIDLYGASWAKNVIDIEASLQATYTTGAPLTVGAYPVGQIVNPANTMDLYYFDGTNYRKFANEQAFVANGFNFNNVVTTTKTITAGGTPISGVEAPLAGVEGGAGSGSIPAGGSGLTVALAGNTAAAANVPQSAVQVPFLSFNVTASNDGAVVIKTVTISRGGIGAADDFSGVYLYDGATRLTTSRTVNSTSNKATFTGLNYSVPAGQTKTLTVKADMAAASINNNYFSIVAASDIDASGATVAGTFPVMGNTMVGVSQSVGTVTVAKSGSISNPKAGETGAKVAEFKLDMGTEDGTFNAITLYQVGNIANDKLSNFVLKQAGTTIASAATMTGSNVNFVLTTPMALDKGTSRVFEVYADVTSTARSGDTIRFYVDNNADVWAVGKTYGFGLGVTRTAYDNSAANGTDASWSSIDAGQLTISQKGPAVQDYATQKQDVELLRFDVASQINAEVRSTLITLTAGGTDADADNNDAGGLFNSTVANYTDIKLVDVANGSIIAGPQDLSYSVVADDASKQLTFTDTWNLESGKTRTVKVTADIANFTPQANETIKAQMDAFSGSAVKNLDTNIFVAAAEIVPNSAIVGANHNVKAGTLTTTLSATPSLQTYINGTSDVAMLGLNITAGTGKDVKVTSIMATVTGANSCDTEANCIGSAMLYDGTTLLATKNISGTTITFSNLTTMITKGTTKTLVIKTNLIKLGSVAGGTTLSFAIAAAGDVTAQDADGNSVDNIGTVTGPAHVIASAGTINATLAADDAETESQVILAGASNVVLAKYRFTATNEDLKVTKMRITLPDGTADEISTIALYDGATKLTADVSVTDAGGSDYADFNAFVADFLVLKDGNKTMTVKATLNTTANGGDSGTAITAQFADSANFEARGINSSDTVVTTTTGGDITGRSMVFRKAKLTFAEQAIGSAISNGSENEVYKWTITADGNDAAIKQLVFDVTLTDNVGTNNTLTAGSWKLFKGSTDITSLVDIHQAAGTTVEATNDLGEGTSKLIVTWNDEEMISAGGTVAYTLRSTLGGFATGADDDSIRVILNNDSSTATAGFNKLVDLDQTASQYTAGIGDGTVTAGQHHGTAAATPTVGANIIWSDWSVVSHAATLADTIGDAGGDTVVVSTSSADWSNSYLLKNLPFSGKTMTN